MAQAPLDHVFANSPWHTKGHEGSAHADHLDRGGARGDGETFRDEDIQNLFDDTVDERNPAPPAMYKIP